MSKSECLSYTRNKKANYIPLTLGPPSLRIETGVCPTGICPTDKGTVVVVVESLK